MAKARAHEVNPTGETSPGLRADPSQLSKVEFIKIEKNLASLGFFTPSSKRVQNEKGKTITFVKVIDGKHIEARATIAPAALYGLPITADQDKYLALQKLINDIQRRDGRVENPIRFTSAELLRLLGKSDQGKNYREVAEWLDVMFYTGISSEGAVYFAGQKRWVKDRFHVFERAVSVGKELPDGTVADRNYVWLSEWQLENINNNHVLPIDLETYRELRNHIAKALVPLLQIWLYASRDEGTYSKRYDELCEMLNLRRYLQPSRIREQLAPSLDELRGHGYLAEWSIEQTKGRKGYKIVFRHGEKFQRDRRRRLGMGEPDEAIDVSAIVDDRVDVEVPEAAKERDTNERDALVKELTNRGVSARQARQVVSRNSPEQIRDQLEWGDHVIHTDPSKIGNPAGFYVSLIRDNITVSDTFETTRKREERAAAAEARRVDRAAQQWLQDAYRAYQEQQAEQYLSGLGPAQLEERLAAAKTELLEEHKNLQRVMSAEQLTRLVRAKLASVLVKELPLQSFAAFCEQQKAL